MSSDGERPQLDPPSERCPMPLMKAFKYTIKARAQADQAFRVALLEEALNAFLSNDPGDRQAAPARLR